MSASIPRHDVDVLAAAVGGQQRPEPDLPRGARKGSSPRPVRSRLGPGRRSTPLCSMTPSPSSQDTVTQLIAAVRRVRREVPGAAAVVAEVASAHDYDDPGKPEDHLERSGRPRGAHGRARARRPGRLAGPAGAGAGPRRGRSRAAGAGRRAGRRVVDPGRSRRPPGEPRSRIAPAGSPGTGWSAWSTPRPGMRTETVHRRRTGSEAAASQSSPTPGWSPPAADQGRSGAWHDAGIGIELLHAEDPAGRGAGLDGAWPGRGRGARRPRPRAGTGRWSSRGRSDRVVPSRFTMDAVTIDEATGTTTCQASVTPPAEPDPSRAAFGVACRGWPLRRRSAPRRRKAGA